MQPNHAAEHLLSCLEEWDSDRFVSGLHPNARLGFGGEVAATGRRQIRRLLVRAFGCLSHLQISRQVIWRRGQVSVLDLDVRCEQLDGRLMFFPLTVVLRMSGEEIADIQLFLNDQAAIGRFLAPAA